MALDSMVTSQARAACCRHGPQAKAAFCGLLQTPGEPIDAPGKHACSRQVHSSGTAALGTTLTPAVQQVTPQTAATEAQAVQHVLVCLNAPPLDPSASPDGCHMKAGDKMSEPPFLALEQHRSDHAVSAT